MPLPPHDDGDRDDDRDERGSRGGVAPTKHRRRRRRHDACPARRGGRSRRRRGRQHARRSARSRRGRGVDAVVVGDVHGARRRLELLGRRAEHARRLRIRRAGHAVVRPPRHRDDRRRGRNRRRSRRRAERREQLARVDRGRTRRRLGLDQARDQLAHLDRHRRERRRRIELGRRERWKAQLIPERATAHQLDEDHAERVQIAGRQRGPRQHRLGRHVARRPHDHAALRGVRALLAERLREPEVEHLDVVATRALVEHDQVLELEIAMHDVQRVRRIQRVADLHPDVRDAGDRKRALALEHTEERASLDQLHRDEQAPVVDLPEVEHAHRVGVRELARELGFAKEAADRHRVTRERAIDQLDRDLRAPPSAATRDTRLRHPALPQQAADLRILPSMTVPMRSSLLPPSLTSRVPHFRRTSCPRARR